MWLLFPSLKKYLRLNLLSLWDVDPLHAAVVVIPDVIMAVTKHVQTIVLMDAIKLVKADARIPAWAIAKVIAWVVVSNHVKAVVRNHVSAAVKILHDEVNGSLLKY